MLKNRTELETTEELFQNFIRANYESIKKDTPLNPTITKDDEWAAENCWDNHYQKLQEVGK